MALAGDPDIASAFKDFFQDPDPALMAGTTDWLNAIAFHVPPSPSPASLPSPRDPRVSNPEGPPACWPGYPLGSLPALPCGPAGFRSTSHFPGRFTPRSVRSCLRAPPQFHGQEANLGSSGTWTSDVVEAGGSVCEDSWRGSTLTHGSHPTDCRSASSTGTGVGKGSALRPERQQPQPLQVGQPPQQYDQPPQLLSGSWRVTSTPQAPPQLQKPQPQQQPRFSPETGLLLPLQWPPQPQHGQPGVCEGAPLLAAGAGSLQQYAHPGATALHPSTVPARAAALPPLPPLAPQRMAGPQPGGYRLWRGALGQPVTTGRLPMAAMAAASTTTPDTRTPGMRAEAAAALASDVDMLTPRRYLAAADVAAVAVAVAASAPPPACPCFPPTAHSGPSVPSTGFISLASAKERTTPSDDRHHADELSCKSRDSATQLSHGSPGSTMDGVTHGSARSYKLDHLEVMERTGSYQESSGGGEPPPSDRHGSDPHHRHSYHHVPQRRNQNHISEQLHHQAYQDSQQQQQQGHACSSHNGYNLGYICPGLRNPGPAPAAATASASVSVRLAATRGGGSCTGKHPAVTAEEPGHHHNHHNLQQHQQYPRPHPKQGEVMIECPWAEAGGMAAPPLPLYPCPYLHAHRSAATLPPHAERALVDFAQDLGLKAGRQQLNVATARQIGLQLHAYQQQQPQERKGGLQVTTGGGCRTDIGPYGTFVVLQDRSVQYAFVAVAKVQGEQTNMGGITSGRVPVPLDSPPATFLLSVSGRRCTCGSTHGDSCVQEGHPYHQVVKYLLAFGSQPHDVSLAARWTEFNVSKKGQPPVPLRGLWVPQAPRAVLWHVKPARIRAPAAVAAAATAAPVAVAATAAAVTAAAAVGGPGRRQVPVTVKRRRRQSGRSKRRHTAGGEGSGAEAAAWDGGGRVEGEGEIAEGDVVAAGAVGTEDGYGTIEDGDDEEEAEV